MFIHVVDVAISLHLGMINSRDGIISCRTCIIFLLYYMIDVLFSNIDFLSSMIDHLNNAIYIRYIMILFRIGSIYVLHSPLTPFRITMRVAGTGLHPEYHKND